MSKNELEMREKGARFNICFDKKKQGDIIGDGAAG